MENIHPKKRFSEEEILEKVEKSIDHNMERVMNIGFVQKFLNHKIVKNILNSHFVNEINYKIQSYLKTICIAMGRVLIVVGIVGIIVSIFFRLSQIGFSFSLSFGLGLHELIYILLIILSSLISFFMGIGMLRFKKRVISLVILLFIVSAILFIINRIPVRIYLYSSSGNFSGSLFVFLINFVLLTLIVKNEHVFKN